jgi:hypothetical protein
MFYITRKNSWGEYLFWNAHHKNFKYSGGSGYASLNSAKTALSSIIHTYKISPVGVEIASTETILNSYNNTVEE